MNGSLIAVIIYILTGVFGYLCFTSYPNPDFILKDKNILQVSIP